VTAVLATPRLVRQARLVLAAARYEMRKATAFRTGFLVREVLRGISRPLVMVFVYRALLDASGRADIRGFAFLDLVHYMILVATLEKVVIHERSFEMSQQIFDGYITKYLVMPMRYYALVLGRWLQFTVLQLGVAAAFYAAGLVLLPHAWPLPASPGALSKALVLVLMGSYCYLLLYTILHTLAFWLDVIWTLLIASRFVTLFVSGSLVPVAIMPDAFRAAFHWLFPYWTLSAPIEILMGRAGAPSFADGVMVLGATILVLDALRRGLWRRGLLRYTGSGM
jgi:ABC-2 type transport system permease protein